MRKWKSRSLLVAVGGDWQRAARDCGCVAVMRGLWAEGRGELGWGDGWGCGANRRWRWRVLAAPAVLATLAMHALPAMRATLAGLAVSGRRWRGGTGSVQSGKGLAVRRERGGSGMGQPAASRRSRPAKRPSMTPSMREVRSVSAWTSVGRSARSARTSARKAWLSARVSRRMVSSRPITVAPTARIPMSSGGHGRHLGYRSVSGPSSVALKNAKSR